MPDSVSKRQRSEIMASVKSRGNLTTEAKVEAALQEANIGGWQKHAQILGNPDFYFPDCRLALFVDGCFWHACPKHLRLPSSNTEYWHAKIDRNRRRDNRNRRKLRGQGFHVMRVWEHDLKRDTWLKRLRTMLRRLGSE